MTQETGKRLNGAAAAAHALQGPRGILDGHYVGAGGVCLFVYNPKLDTIGKWTQGSLRKEVVD